MVITYVFNVRDDEWQTAVMNVYFIISKPFVFFLRGRRARTRPGLA